MVLDSSDCKTGFLFLALFLTIFCFRQSFFLSLCACFLRRKYGKHGGRRSDDDCNTVCPNPAPNDGAFCGGPWRNLVYRLTWPRVKLPGLFEEYYDGCYQDHNHDRAFEWLQTQGTWADRCFDECTVWRGHDNRNYAALQYGGECWCGNVNKVSKVYCM